VFRQLGVFGLVQMGIFVGLILIAYIYDWKRGGLEWD
jgi:NADH-quinone oxidoreductase subunit A